MSRIAEVRPVYVSYCAECCDGDGPHDDAEVAEAWTAAHNAEHHAPKATGELAAVFDQAVEAVAVELETMMHNTWNGGQRRPSNYRAAAADARRTPNPYRKADS